MHGCVHLTSYHKLDININHLGWLYKEANFRRGHQEEFMLKISMFWFMQFYPWFLREHKDTFRLLIGHLANYKDRCKVWVHWPTVKWLLPSADFYGYSDE